MLVQERRRHVLDLVTRRGFITLSDLAEAVQVSESTLRRDLDHWDHKGLVKRIRGGAMFVGEGAMLPALEDRTSSQIAEKRLNIPGLPEETARRWRDECHILELTLRD